MLPVFTVEGIVGGRTRGVVGAVSRTTHGGESWVADGWTGFLKGGTRLIAGRWYRQVDLWAFTPEEEADLDAIRARSVWEVLDGYWGERALIVLDRTRHWQKVWFEPGDAVEMQRRGVTWLKRSVEGEAREGRLIEEGWDHEHCAICWAKIGRGGEPAAYMSDDRSWVCQRCYHDFVESRSLSFIPES